MRRGDDESSRCLPNEAIVLLRSVVFDLEACGMWFGLRPGQLTEANSWPLKPKTLNCQPGCCLPCLTLRNTTPRGLTSSMPSAALQFAHFSHSIPFYLLGLVPGHLNPLEIPSKLPTGRLAYNAMQVPLLPLLQGIPAGKEIARSVSSGAASERTFFSAPASTTGCYQQPCCSRLQLVLDRLRLYGPSKSIDWGLGSGCARENRISEHRDLSSRRSLQLFNDPKAASTQSLALPLLSILQGPVAAGPIMPPVAVVCGRCG